MFRLTIGNFILVEYKMNEKISNEEVYTYFI